MGPRRPLPHLVMIGVTRRFRSVLFAIAAHGLLSTASPTLAETRLFTAGVIELRTDYDAETAKKLLEELDVELKVLAGYWQMPANQKIEIRVVGDFVSWPPNSIPREAKQLIREGVGTTLTERKTLGDVVTVKSIVYAAHQGRAPQHELVHAYCWQTFGECGPAWYAEGMAELFAYRRDDGSVACPGYMIKYLNQLDSLPLKKMLYGDRIGPEHQWQRYAEWWALCYLLTHHPHYAERFRKLGQEMLTGKKFELLTTIDERGRLDADYQRFLKDVRPGYKFPAPPAETTQ